TSTPARYVVSLLIQRPPLSPLFPYTTLFRSGGGGCLRSGGRCGKGISLTSDQKLDQPRTDCKATVAGGGRPRRPAPGRPFQRKRSEEHTTELQSREKLVCRLLLEKKKKNTK